MRYMVVGREGRVVRMENEEWRLEDGGMGWDGSFDD